MGRGVRNCIFKVQHTSDNYELIASVYSVTRSTEVGPSYQSVMKRKRIHEALPHTVDPLSTTASWRGASIVFRRVPNGDSTTF